jgi:hypothetical protein
VSRQTSSDDKENYSSPPGSGDDQITELPNKTEKISVKERTKTFNKMASEVRKICTWFEILSILTTKIFSIQGKKCQGVEVKYWIGKAWRTLANQEVILRIGPLGKLGHFESTAEIFLVYIASISLASGPILSITSWYAKVLRGKSKVKV